ncbi:MAG: AraC family transcriptional regulator [Pseudomonadota bacterium]
MTDAVKRTLWKIEHRIADPLTLGGLAAEVGMSPYQLARAFPMRTGWPVMRYLRARRLTEATKLIAAGSPILEAAFDVGYTTHEAFTRAFTDRFGIPPRDARSADRLATLDLVETIVMKDAAVLIPPRHAPRLTCRWCRETLHIRGNPRDPGTLDAVRGDRTLHAQARRADCLWCHV